jgi:hypothetical protein
MQNELLDFVLSVYKEFVAKAIENADDVIYL